MTPEIQNNTPEQPDTTDTTPPTVVEEPPPEPVAAETPPPQPETPQEPAQWQPEKHRFGSIAILVATVAGVLLALYAFRLPPFGLGKVYTNNAYVRGNITVVSPHVGGYVQNVLVRDFDTVKAGQPLVEIDRAPYLSKVEQAKAGILAQQAVLDRANREWKRIKGVSNDAISQSSRDAAQTAVKQAEAALTQAKEQYAIAQQNILNAGVGREGAAAAIDNAKAMLALAEQELGHTTVYAPADGLLGEVAVKKGQLVSAGTQLMSVVPAARWIVANIKETDMKNIRSG